MLQLERYCATQVSDYTRPRSLMVLRPPRPPIYPPLMASCPPPLFLLDFRPTADLPLAARGAVRVRLSQCQCRCRGVFERAFPLLPVQREELLARVLDTALNSVSRLRRGLLSGKFPRRGVDFFRKCPLRWRAQSLPLRIFEICNFLLASSFRAPRRSDPARASYTGRPRTRR